MEQDIRAAREDEVKHLFKFRALSMSGIQVGRAAPTIGDDACNQRFQSPIGAIGGYQHRYERKIRRPVCEVPIHAGQNIRAAADRVQRFDQRTDRGRHGGKRQEFWHFTCNDLALGR